MAKKGLGKGLGAIFGEDVVKERQRKRLKLKQKQRQQRRWMKKAVF